MEHTTNEQKAAEILGCTQKDCDKCDFHNQSCFEYKHLIKMAKWKDKQFTELINALPTPLKELIKAFANYNESLTKNE